MVFPHLAAQAKAAENENTSPPPQPRRPAPRQRTPAERIRLDLPLRIALLGFSFLAGFGVAAYLLFTLRPALAVLAAVLGIVVGAILFRMVHIAAQWERGVVLRLGRFRGVRGPGVILIFPIVDYLRLLDTRVQTVDIPQQRVITRDNIPVSIDGVLYFVVRDAGAAFTRVQDFEHAILQYAQATLRDVVGRMTLDDMLAEREKIEKEIESAVGRHVKEWGLDVDALRLLDIDMPEDLKRMMSRQASAEREKRATITKAEGDKLAAVNLAAAASTMLGSPGAMQLRTLQTLDGLGSSPSNTVVLAVPTEILEMVRRTPSSRSGSDDGGR